MYVRKVAEHAEVTRVTIETYVVATPSAPNAPLASIIANEAIASDVSTEVANDVALAEVPRDPTEEALVDVAEASAFQEPPSRIVPFASFVVNERVASIDVIVPTKVEDDVPPVDIAYN